MIPLGDTLLYASLAVSVIAIVGLLVREFKDIELLNKALLLSKLCLPSRQFFADSCRAASMILILQHLNYLSSPQELPHLYLKILFLSRHRTISYDCNTRKLGLLRPNPLNG